MVHGICLCANPVSPVGFVLGSCVPSVLLVSRFVSPGPARVPKEMEIWLGRCTMVMMIALVHGIAIEMVPNVYHDLQIRHALVLTLCQG
jgi:hypothetical protein